MLRNENFVLHIILLKMFGSKMSSGFVFYLHILLISMYLIYDETHRVVFHMEWYKK